MIHGFPNQKTLDESLNFTKQGDLYFGKVVWVKPEDKGKKEQKNPNALRDRSILNLVFLKNFKTTDEKTWTNGTVYDPQWKDLYRTALLY